MLLWLTNLGFGASEIESILPGSIPVLLAANVSVEIGVAITTVASPDVTVQTE